MTKHGEPSVVMLSTLEYDKLKARKNSLKDFFLAAPRVDLGREVELLPQGHLDCGRLCRNRSFPGEPLG